MDSQVKHILLQEVKRQNTTIELIASENFASDAVRSLCGSIFTNKYAGHTRLVLAHLGLDQWLDVIIGTGDSDCPYRKPDPLFTAHALEKMDCASEDALMIGDSPYDLAAAEAGCIACYLVATGSHSTEQLSEYIASNYIYKDLNELGEKLFGLELPK